MNRIYKSETVKILQTTNEVLMNAKAQLYKISLDKDSIARYREFGNRMYDETSALNSSKIEGKEEGRIEEKIILSKKFQS
ncbi:hypothetical protein ACSXAY_19150 (plasmid) [Clostridium perfringens]